MLQNQFIPVRESRHFTVIAEDFGFIGSVLVIAPLSHVDLLMLKIT